MGMTMTAADVGEILGWLAKTAGRDLRNQGTHSVVIESAMNAPSRGRRRGDGFIPLAILGGPRCRRGGGGWSR